MKIEIIQCQKDNTGSPGILTPGSTGAMDDSAPSTKRRVHVDFINMKNMNAIPINPRTTPMWPSILIGMAINSPIINSSPPIPIKYGTEENIPDRIRTMPNNDDIIPVVIIFFVSFLAKVSIKFNPIFVLYKARIPWTCQLFFVLKKIIKIRP